MNPPVKENVTGRKTIRVVLAEGQGMVLGALAALLEIEGDISVVGQARNGKEALEAVLAHKPDVFITDIEMPHMSGLDVAAELKRRKTGTRVVIVTTFARSGYLRRALEAGASGYLLKNTGLLQIVEALRELYDGGSPMSANIARKLVNNFQEQIQDEAPADISLLSIRENEILHLLSQGLLYKEIAEQLGISTSTVRQHIHRIYEKLHVQNRTEALNKAFKNK